MNISSVARRWRGAAAAARARRASGLRAALCLTLIAGLTGGCYLLESAQGQLALMARREPIARVIGRPSTPPALRRQLEAAAAILQFARHDLGLPDNGSYRSYADLGRPYVVWNVVAAPEFSVDARQWCYPIAGCVAYRGYFVESRARSFAAQLRQQGLDVNIGGVAAYSTLGHFDDPILNTMVGWNDIELASIIFHELTHQLIYVPGDSSFNEALATEVEEEGLRRWLIASGRDAELAEHVMQHGRYLQVIDLLNRTRSVLGSLYGSGVDPGVMRERKRAAFADMRDAYMHLKSGWSGRAPLADWFAADVNNAHLAAVATYFGCVPGFERELQAAGGNLTLFYRRIRDLAKLEQERRDALVCGQP